MSTLARQVLYKVQYIGNKVPISPKIAWLSLYPYVNIARSLGISILRTNNEPNIIPNSVKFKLPSSRLALHLSNNSKQQAKCSHQSRRTPFYTYFITAGRCLSGFDCTNRIVSYHTLPHSPPRRPVNTWYYTKSTLPILSAPFVAYFLKLLCPVTFPLSRMLSLTAADCMNT